LADLISILTLIRDEELSKKRLPLDTLINRTDDELVDISNIVEIFDSASNIITLLRNTSKIMNLKSDRKKTIKVRYNYTFARNSLIKTINAVSGRYIDELTAKYSGFQWI
jgi:hypothetical protein